MWEELWDGGTQPPPPNPPQGGGATNKGQSPEKESRKNKNALTQGRTGRFTAILGFVKNG